jgi:hypothetical protein
MKYDVLRDDLELSEDSEVSDILGEEIEISQLHLKFGDERGDSTLAREAAISLTAFFFRLRYRYSDSSYSGECQRGLYGEEDRPQR